MNVHQISVTYVAEQDRLLARVNTREGRELQCWLTRRLALGASPLIERAVLDQVARRGGLSPARLAAMDDLGRRAVAQFQGSETLKDADFSTPYKTPEAAGVPLFDVPLLVTEVNLTTLANGQLQFQFVEKLAGKPRQRSIQMTLSDKLVQAFVHLLDKAIQQSQWREAGESGTDTASGAGLVGRLEKSGYLN